MMPGMGGPMPGGPAKQPWSELYFHQKVKHLGDTAADYVCSKQAWWLPTVMLSSAVAVLLFSGPMGVPTLMATAAQVGTPIPSTSTFGMEMPHAPGQGGGGGGGGGGAGAEDEDFEEM